MATPVPRDDTSSSESSSTRRIIYKVYGTATRVQAITAVGFGTFAIIHTCQIAAGAFFGVEAADRALLLARPFYQDAEALMVTGSMNGHLLAGLIKSALGYYLNLNKNEVNNHNSSLLRYHGLTGQLMVPLVMVHYWLARGLPVQVMGDSAFIDFGIIGWGLQNKRALTWGWHLALIGVGVYHMVGGAQLAFQRTFGLTSKTPTTTTAATTKTTTQTIKQSPLPDQEEAMVTAAGTPSPTSLAHKIVIPHVIIVGISTIMVAGLVAVSRVDKIPLRHVYQDIYSRILPEFLFNKA